MDNIEQRNPAAYVWLGVGWVTVLYGLLILFTKPISWGDTIVYAPQIVDFSKGAMPRSEIWEFRSPVLAADRRSGVADGRLLLVASIRR
jgi:hypothetical protein